MADLIKRRRPLARCDHDRGSVLVCFVALNSNDVFAFWHFNDYRSGERARGQRNTQQQVAVIGSAVALLMGLRNGEVVARVVRDLDDGGKVLVIDGAKTAAGSRRVEIPDVLRPHLLQLAKDRGAMERLFPGLTKDGMRYWTRRLCESAGLPAVTPHGLRGTNATASLRANTNPHLVAAALGHTSIAVTLRHYANPEAVAQARQEVATAVLVPKNPSKNPSKTFGRDASADEAVSTGSAACSIAARSAS